MKKIDMFEMLLAFCEVAEANRAEELRKFAEIFSGGKEETVQARVKRVLARWKADSAQASYPLTLRKNLAAIGSGLSACKAKQQTKDIDAILLMFEGSDTASVDSFIDRINAALAAPPVKAPGPKKPKPVADPALARELADELARTVRDPGAFSIVVDRLEDRKLVPTPTLHAIGHRFLGNDKSYKGRKPVIEDITKRQMIEASIHAEDKAFERIAV